MLLLIIILSEIGVQFSACITCAKELGVEERLADLGVDLVKWLEPLSLILKSDKKLLTI